MHPLCRYAFNNDPDPTALAGAERSCPTLFMPYTWNAEHPRHLSTVMPVHIT